jgi:hypothetical protein
MPQQCRVDSLTLDKLANGPSKTEYNPQPPGDGGWVDGQVEDHDRNGQPHMLLVCQQWSHMRQVVPDIECTPDELGHNGRDRYQQ